MIELTIEWDNPKQIPAKSYICGYCGDRCSSHMGYKGLARHNTWGNHHAYLYICGGCSQPTFKIDYPDAMATPGPKIGISVKSLPQDINLLYSEARTAFSAGAPTASTLLCRKILMNTAVAEGAVEGNNFAFYIKYLKEHGLLPPKSDKWIDQIRLNGNEATHRADAVSMELAERTLQMTGSLLMYCYELSDPEGA
jgi:Domain of unknown function (DUF4145)